MDVLAAADHQLLEPPGDREAPVLLAAEVARAPPAAGVRRPHVDLAVDQADLLARHRDPVQRDHADGLGAAVPVAQVPAEPRPERLPQVGGQRGAAGQARRGHGRVGVQESPVDRGHPGEQREVARPQQLRGAVHVEGVHDVRARAERGDGQHAQRVPEDVEQRQRPQHAVVGGETQQSRVRPGDRAQPRGLRRHHGLRLAGGAGGEQQPRRVVEAQVVTGRHVGGPGQLVDGEHAHRGHPPDLLQVRPVGHDRGRATAPEQVGEVGVGAPRVERHAHRARPRDAQRRLDHGHAVGQQQRDPFTPGHAQVPGDARRGVGQLGVGGGPAGVGEGGLAAGRRRVVAQECGQRLRSQ